MPFIRINQSPLSSNPGPVDLHYRDIGAGSPILFLHGGWGYEVYPFGDQLSAIDAKHRVIIPDRTGYGRSGKIDRLPSDFHARASVETTDLIDALGLDRPVLWGHSDGAVIAVMMALANPAKFRGLILEAFHFYRVKPGSRGFFEEMMDDPSRLGERVTAVLARDHGEDYWRQLIELNGRAWLRIADDSSSPNQDLYDGRLPDISIPVLFIHGKRDPRTEPGEMEAVRERLPSSDWAMIEEGAHSPHSERAASAHCARAAEDFLAKISLRV